MADVVLGRAGETVQVDLDLCARTGRRTDERVTLRGTTMPGWILLLLLLTVVGFLLAYLFTSQRYVVTLPFVHEAHDRWKRYRYASWVVGLAGLTSVVAAAGGVGEHSATVGVAGIVLVAVAIVASAINTARHGLVVRMTRDHQLLLVHAHPAFAAALASASVEVRR